MQLSAEIPPHISVIEFVDRAERRSFRRNQQGIEHVGKRYWEQRFWARSYSSTRFGIIIDEIIKRYLYRHIHKDGISIFI